MSESVEEDENTVDEDEDSQDWDEDQVWTVTHGGVVNVPIHEAANVQDGMDSNSDGDGETDLPVVYVVGTMDEDVDSQGNPLDGPDSDNDNDNESDSDDDSYIDSDIASNNSDHTPDIGDTADQRTTIYLANYINAALYHSDPYNSQIADFPQFDTWPAFLHLSPTLFADATVDPLASNGPNGGANMDPWISRDWARHLARDRMPPPGMARDSGVWEWVYRPENDSYVVLLAWWEAPDDDEGMGGYAEYGEARYDLKWNEECGLYLASPVEYGC